MAKITHLPKNQFYPVLGLITISIIAFALALNDDTIYLWDRNVIPITDEGNTVHIYLSSDPATKICMNDFVCYEDTTNLWFNPGGQVTFHNNDDAIHNIGIFSVNDDYECIKSDDADLLSSGTLSSGESWTYKPSKDLYTRSAEDQSLIWGKVCYYDSLNSDFVGSIDISPGYDVATLIYMSGSLIAAIISFRVSKHYFGGEMFPKAYLFLGLAFCCWFIGDMLYFVNDYVEDLPALNIKNTIIFDPRDSAPPNQFLLEAADIVYLAFYPFAALHLYLNANYYMPKKSGLIKLVLFGVPLAGAIIFFAQFGAITFESIFGSFNAVGAAVNLGLVIYGVKVFNSTDLKPAWFLLLAGLTISAIGDFLYYQVENFNDEYAIYSSSTVMFVLAYMIISYALYRHTKIFPAK